MMWYGRMAFLLKGCNGDDALVSEHDVKISTIQAALISVIWYREINFSDVFASVSVIAFGRLLRLQKF